MNRLLATAALLLALASPAAAQWVVPDRTVPAAQAEATRLWDYYAILSEDTFRGPKNLSEAYAGRRDDDGPGFLGQKQSRDARYQELSRAQEEHRAFVCTLGYVNGWVGTIDYATEDGALSIRIGDSWDYNVRTFNLNSHPNIAKDTPLYQAIGHLDKGMKVKFSGRIAMKGTCTDLTGWAIEFVQVSPL